MHEENPFAAPATDTESLGHPNLGVGDGIWRDGNRLVMYKAAILPDRCVRCNAPADGLRLRRKLMWHTPWLYLIILFNLLIYAVIALIVSHRATVDMGICKQHLQRRRRSILAAWIVVLVSFGLMVFGFSSAEYLGLGVLGLVGILVGIVIGFIGSRFVYPTRIDPHYVWLARVNSSYLAELPSLRG